MSIGVATEAGEAVGTVRLVLDDTAGNEDLAEVDYLIVRPGRRGAGIGRGLVHALCQRTERPRIRGYVPVGHFGGMGLAAAVGATPGIIERQNRVRVADLDRQMLEGWVHRARGSWPRLLAGVLRGALPGRTPRAVRHARTRVMNTAPRSAGDEDVLPTPAEVRADHQALCRRMGWVWTACARHDATGKLVGLHAAVGQPMPVPGSASSGTPGWIRPHRNLGLGPLAEGGERSPPHG